MPTRLGPLRTLAFTVFALSMASSAAAQPKAIQLNELCTISVLNRNVRVSPDGSWVLPNIPANFGLVRARVTCIVDGQTVSGESEPFLVPANGVINKPHIVFGRTTPIPQSVTVTAPQPVLTAIGATEQLTVTARYSDGTSKDVTTGAGTAYTISNAAIATVTSDGVVRDVTSGTVVIQATLEGASGMASVRIAPAGVDTDGDGMPDDYEIAHGLNPTNPVDAQEDPDHDGLINLQEYRLGTDPRNTDTDADGLSDGQEIAGGTNPLLWDTDGDGISDGVEAQVGTNPLDGSSFNLAASLKALRMTPAAFIINFNTIEGEASVRLTVTGTMLDGRTLDATARGLNFSSTDLTICNFGATPGQIFAGQSGPCTITATLGSLVASASGTVRTYAPTALSFVSIPGFANNVDVSGDYAFVAAGSAGLQIVDVSNRLSPRIVASLGLPGNANDVKVDGARAYVAAGSAGLHIVDVTTPLSPQLLGSVDTPGDAYDVRASGNLAFVADGPTGLQIVDVSSPDHAHIIGSLPLTGTSHGVDVAGRRAVVAAGSALKVVDVTNPVTPVVVGSVSLPDETRDVVLLNESVAYVADYQGSLQVVDLSNPAAPHVVGSTTTTLGGILMDVATAPPFVLGADVFFVNGVPIVDATLPNNPVPRAILNFSAFRDDNGTGIAVDGSYVYMTASRGLVENGTSEDTRLYIGQYRALEDVNGVAPTVSLDAPTEGTTFIEGETIHVTATAHDDVGVAGVSFLTDGAMAFTDTSAPYQFTVTAPTGAGSMTLSATAVDLGANVGASRDVHIAIIPDPLTTVVGRVVSRDLQPLAGVNVSVPGHSGTSAADGTFSIPGVSTLQTALSVNASSAVNGTVLSGSSAIVPVVRGGTTNVGDIVAAATTFETDLGTFVPQCNFCNVDIPLPFAFPIGGSTYTMVHANSGYLWTDGGDYMEVFCCNTRTDGTVPGAGLYVNDAVPGRVVVTWNRQFSSATGTDLNTVQIVLFADGRIQYGYRGVSPRAQVEVGLFTATRSIFRQVDFSTLTSLSIGATEAVYEDFDPFSNRFDLDGGFMIFTPTTLGGYEIHPVPDVTPPVCTITNPPDGSTLFEGEVLSVDVTATDNGAVSRVSIASNVGGLNVNPTDAPYSAPFVVPVGVSQVIFTAAAYDAWQNAATCTSTVAVVSGPPPTLTITSPTDGTALTAGSTIPIVVDAVNRVPVNRVDLQVNGVLLSSDVTAPFTFLFTVPKGVDSLSISVSGVNTVGTIGTSPIVHAAVAADPLTTVQGSVVDRLGAPVGGADVALQLHGASLEIFNVDTPLSALPDLSGLTPNRVTTVSALNLRNPSGVFGADPFGFGPSVSHAARFTATIRNAAPTYTFRLGVNGGGRLKINGTTVIDLPLAGQFQEATGTIAVGQAIALEILTFDNGNPELQLSYGPADATELAIVPPGELTPALGQTSGTSSGDGTFAIANVPTTLGSIVARVSAVVGGKTATGHSAPVSPVAGGVTDVGVVRVFDFNTIYGAAFNGPNGPANLYRVDQTTGQATLVGPIGFWRVSAMDTAADGTVYGVGVNPATGRSVLLTIDPQTGAGHQIGPTGVESLGFGTGVADISFRPSDGRLFAYLESGDGLGTIDISTGVATALGSTGVSCCGNGMAFAPDGRLFHANESALHVLNQTTGRATDTVPLTYPAVPGSTGFSRINSMDFQTDTGELFGFIRGDGFSGGGAVTYLVKVNITTGVVTLVGNRTVNGMDSLTWGPR